MSLEIVLGASAGGAAATIDLEELLATRLLVQGNSGSGKSHLLRRILEQSAPHVQQIVIDPEGDFVSLADKFQHIVVDANRSEADLDCIAARVRERRVSVVLNLENLEQSLQLRAAAIFLDGLFEAPRAHWYPALVVVDEAQLFAPMASGDVSDEARRVSLTAMVNLMCRGRKRGLAGIIATQRLAKLAKNVAAEASNFLMGRTMLDIDMARAADLLGMERRQAEMFRDLPRGSFVGLGPAIARRAVQIKVGSVETASRGVTPRLMPPPDMSDADSEEILAPAPVSAPRIVERKPPPAPSTTDIFAEIARAEEAAAPDEESATPMLSAEERDHRCRQIVHEMVSDETGSRPEGALYQDFQIRCRIQRLPGALPGLDEFRGWLEDGRAGVTPEEAATEAWRRVVDVARTVPSDLRGVFVLFAHAAMRGEPCPSDLDVARMCGTRSVGRARNRLQQLDRQGAIVLRNTMKGARIAVLPDLGWETLAGDPAAPARDGAVERLAG
ncbi:helicase HerA domain-containing protein [Blastochloris sulfoviridis]|uniref:helicase HerA domain-containing protein n=1 Tax=Blastochloris sulfoviridis TaxID=50712 RepID=UPI001FEC7F6B|nr:DUF87 domain-containing protein [Blastochloris sulfoviridis]